MPVHGHNACIKSYKARSLAMAVGGSGGEATWVSSGGFGGGARYPREVGGVLRAGVWGAVTVVLSIIRPLNEWCAMEEPPSLSS